MPPAGIFFEQRRAGRQVKRVYLDWNATAPLRPEAREAMLKAMDVVGNPSSVHAEGRAAKAIVEKARGQVADLVGCEPSEVVFTSGATESLQTVCCQNWDMAQCSNVEHDAIASLLPALEECQYGGGAFLNEHGIYMPDGTVSGFGFYSATVKRGDKDWPHKSTGLFTLTTANSETGVIQPVDEVFQDFSGEMEISRRLCDVTQSVSRIPLNASMRPFEFAACSAHKIGGPKGVGTLYVKSGIDISSAKGGGQEMGRRSGTENVIGIAGFGAAAVAAKRDLENGVWERVEKLRDDLEDALASAAPDIIFFGKDVARLPNTSCFAVPGWKGETQVMQMDLAGYAISAGSACSSGKVKESRVLRAMGFDSVTASSAIRVSMGPTTTEAEVMAFADTWIEHYRRWKQRAA